MTFCLPKYLTLINLSFLVNKQINIDLGCCSKEYTDEYRYGRANSWKSMLQVFRGLGKILKQMSSLQLYNTLGPRCVQKEKLGGSFYSLSEEGKNI